MNQPGKALLLLVAPFPPPVHGAAVMARAVAGHSHERATVITANVSPGTLKRSPQYFIKKVYLVTRAAFRLASGVFFARERIIYLSVAGGAGNIYNIFLSGLARLLGYRIHLHHHSYAYLDRFDAIFNALLVVAGSRAVHAVLCPSMGERLAGRYRRVGALCVVSNAAAIPASLTPPRRHEGPLTLGHLSNLSRDKGLLELFCLLRDLRAQSLPVRLVLAGPAENETARQIIAAASQEFPEELEWSGPVYGAEKDRFFNTIDVFLFPTRYRNEAQPLVLFEALAAGVPVIAYGRGCIPCDITAAMGQVIPVDAAFPEQAAAALRPWIDDREALDQARYRAWQAYDALHHRAGEAWQHWMDRLVSPQ